MANAALPKIVLHLQDEYLRIGKNDPVEWRPLASTLGVIEEEIRAALHEAFTVGQQMQLQQVGRDEIRLGERGLLEANRRKKT